MDRFCPTLLGIGAILLAFEVSPALAEEVAAQVRVVKGAVHITLASAQLTQLGLATEILRATQYRATHQLTGIVISPSELLRAHADYQQQNAELAALAQRRAVHEEQLRRLDALTHAGAAVGARDRYEISLALTDITARQATLRAAQQVQTQALRAQWGARLSREVLALESLLLQRLTQQHAYLIRADLGETTATDSPHIQVVMGHDEQPTPAEILDIAPIGTRWGGTSAWLLVNDSKLNFSAESQVGLLVGDQTMSGVRAPRSALVWLNGHSWVYRAINTHEFERVAISIIPMPEDMVFITQALRAEERVVTTGAESLLAEEQRSAIPHEHDD